MSEDSVVPGEIIPADREIRINEGRDTTEVSVENTGDRPIQVGSHFHFFEVNKALKFDREAAFGRRLDIPAGSAVRFEPGEQMTVQLVELGGSKRVTGLNGLTEGSVTSESNRDQALKRARENGFKGA